MAAPPSAEGSAAPVPLSKGRRRFTGHAGVLELWVFLRLQPCVTPGTDLAGEVSSEVCGLQVPSRTVNQSFQPHFWPENCKDSFPSLLPFKIFLPTLSEDLVSYSDTDQAGRSQINTVHTALVRSSKSMDFFFFFLSYILEETAVLWKECKCWRRKERKETKQYHQPIQLSQEQL